MATEMLTRREADTDMRAFQRSAGLVTALLVVVAFLLGAIIF